MLDLGEQFAGYRIDRVLGRGRTSICYEATHSLLLRTVALKVLDADLSAHDAFRERVRRAKLQQAALEHPHLVAIFEVGVADDLLFVAMQLVDGPTLAERLNGARVDRQLVRMLGQVAGAIDAVHKQGFVHGDVSPRSVFLTVQGHPVLGDFALPGLPAGGPAGTATSSYVAPEVRDGTALGPAADVYALGAMLYDGLTGTLGAAGASAHDPRRREALSARRPDLPAALDDVLAAALAASPGARQRSAGQLIREVDAAMNGESRPRVQPETAPAASAGDADVQQAGVGAHGGRAHRVTRRGRVFAGVLAALAGAGVGLALGYGMSGQTASTASARAGALSISYPESWARTQAPAIPGLRLSESIALQAPSALGVRYYVGRAADAHGLKLLPGELRDQVTGNLSGQPVVIGGELEALRFQAVEIRGFPLPVNLYATPIPGGAVIAACYSSPASDDALLAECDRASAAVGVTGVRTFGLGPDAAYGARLREVLKALNFADEGLRERLRKARSRAGQASVAASLARAYDRASRRLRDEVVSGRDEPGHRALVAAFDATAAGFERLAAAARAGRTARYSAARRALRSSESATRAALADLARLGYGA